MFSRVSSRQKGNDLLIFVCGLFCAFATGVRLSYLVIDPAFAIGILLDSSLTEIRARLKRLLWFSSGFLLGSAPIFIVFLLAPQEFYYGNFTYIRLNTIYRELLGHSTAMTLAQKLKYFFEMVLTNIPSALVYAMAIVAATHQAVRYWRRFSSTITALLTLFLLGIFLLVASFSPTPLWPQYFFAPIPFLILWIFLGLEHAARIQKKIPFIAVMMLALLLVSNQNYNGYEKTTLYAEFLDQQTILWVK